MKKLIVLVLVFVSIIALFSTTAAEQTTDNYNYTIEQAQKIALENSKQTVIDEKDIQLKEDQLKNVRQDAANSGAGPDNDGILNTKINAYVKPIQSMAELEAAKSSKDNNNEKLKLDVFKAAEDLLLSVKELDYLQQKVEIAQDKYEMTLAQYNAKTITLLALQSAEYTVDTYKLNLESAKNKNKSYVYGFKNLLGLPFDEIPVTIDGELTYSPDTDNNIDGLIKKALGNSIDVYLKSKALEAKQKTMDFTAELFKESDITYDVNNYDLQISKLDLDDAKQSVEINVKNKYNDLISSQNRLKLSESYLNLQKKNKEDAELRFEKGIIGKAALLTANENHLDALYQTYINIHDYNNLKKDFEFMVGN